MKSGREKPKSEKNISLADIQRFEPSSERKKRRKFWSSGSVLRLFTMVRHKLSRRSNKKMIKK